MGTYHFSTVDKNPITAAPEVIYSLLIRRYTDHNKKKIINIFFIFYFFTGLKKIGHFQPAAVFILPFYEVASLNCCFFFFFFTWQGLSYKYVLAEGIVTISLIIHELLHLFSPVSSDKCQRWEEGKCEQNTSSHI